MSTAEGQPGFFHRVVSRYFLTKYARERGRHPGKPDQFYRDEAEYQARQLLLIPQISLAILVGAAFGYADTTTLPGLTHAQTAILGLILYLFLYWLTSVATRRIVRHDACASHHAHRFDSHRDRVVAEYIYWGSFALAALIPIVFLVLMDAFVWRPA